MSLQQMTMGALCDFNVAKVSPSFIALQWNLLMAEQERRMIHRLSGSASL